MKLVCLLLCVVLSGNAFSQGRIGRVLSDVLARVTPAKMGAVAPKFGQITTAIGLSFVVACGLTGCSEDPKVSGSTSYSYYEESIGVIADEGDHVAFFMMNGDLEVGLLTYDGDGWSRVNSLWHGKQRVDDNSVVGIFSPNNDLVGKEVSLNGAHASREEYKTLFASVSSVYVDADNNPVVLLVKVHSGETYNGNEWIFTPALTLVLQENVFNY